MKPTIEILADLYEFAKIRELKVTKINSSMYEELEEFNVKFERGGEE